MSARAHGGIGGVGPRGGCRGGSGGGGNSEAAARRRARRKSNPLSLQVFIDLPSNLRSAVIGRGGETVKRIQETSGAKVKVPAAGRNGRVKVIGDEVPLLAACRAIAHVVATSTSDAARGLDVLDIAVDAGPQLGRLNGSMHVVNRVDGNATAGGRNGDSEPTLLCRASVTASNGMEFAYVAHAIHVPGNTNNVNESDTANADGEQGEAAAAQARITQEDVEVMLDNYAFAVGADDLPISICCVKDNYIFVSAIEAAGVNTDGGGTEAIV